MGKFIQALANNGFVDYENYILVGSFENGKIHIKNIKTEEEYIIDVKAIEKPEPINILSETEKNITEEIITEEVTGDPLNLLSEEEVGDPFNLLTENKEIIKPRGWALRKEYVDLQGNVFHKGVEQPNLKGTLRPSNI